MTAHEFEVIRSPWEDVFVRLLNRASACVYLASPFIKTRTASLIAKSIHSSLDFRYINSFKLAHFHTGASDLEALRILRKENCTQKSVHNLHAKLFIFDSAAVVTSGNLTPGGLTNNVEFGVLVQGETAEELKRDYLEIFDNRDYPEITPDIVDKADAILRSVPAEKRPRINVSEKELFKGAIDDESTAEKFAGGSDSILSILSPWEKDVFRCLSKIHGDVFTLAEVYYFDDHLGELHPRNRHVRDKIRQQLQYLRSLGLVEFVKPGVYRKLWV